MRSEHEEEEDLRKEDHPQARSLTTEGERIEHEMTHLPFRSWCGRCIKGRGREEDCRKSVEEETVPKEIDR